MLGQIWFQELICFKAQGQLLKLGDSPWIFEPGVCIQIILAAHNCTMEPVHLKKKMYWTVSLPRMYLHILLINSWDELQQTPATILNRD